MENIRIYILFGFLFTINIRVGSYPPKQLVHTYNIPPVNYSLADAVKTDITYKYFTKANMSGIYVTEDPWQMQ
ncbi:hypothetical protein QE152_g19975 [Popillia japonica]|uniref:Uncharacterized protein n=1 Tax=Popillia japonica TaxID=7064 RepID=A0AAW1KPG5_POPJA